MKYPRYPEYRASGVEWLGEVPAHWGVKRLKYAVELAGEKVDEMPDDGRYVALEHIESWTGRQIDGDVELKPESQTNRFREGDVLFGKLRPYLAKVWRASFDGYSSGELLVLRQRDLLPDFAKYFCLTRGFVDLVDSSTYGSKMPRANWDFIGNQLAIIPPLDEQRAIAAFLDRETARIDALIATKRRFIALLQEKRAALVSRAVTRGLDVDVPLKKSGIAWVGEIPANWVVRPLKWIAEVRAGVAKGRKIEHEEAVTVPYLRVANVQDGYLDLDDVAEIEIGADELERYALRAGDVLMNEGGDNDKLGRGHVWRGEVSPCIHQNHVFAVRPRAVRSDWLALVTSSDYAKHYFLSFAKQSTNLASISSTNLKNLPVILPPDDEQAAILGFIERALGGIDRLQTLCESAIDRLVEHRASLIAFAVAGRIDTRESFKAEHVKRHPCESGDPVTSGFKNKDTGFPLWRE